MSKNTLRDKLDQRCKKLMDALKLEMEDIDFICITSDLWSGAKRGFMGITASWLLEDLTRKSVALACPRMAGSHTFDKIAMILEKTVDQFGIHHKTVGCVTDSGKILNSYLDD